MTLPDLAQMSKNDLINLNLAQAKLIAKLQAGIDDLSKKLDKGMKFPTIRVNLFQPPSDDE
jgi:hypothetical protein